MPMRRPLLTALLVLFVAAATPALAQQHTWSGVERIVAVGDLHGDCDAFVKTLRAAKVIDEKENWIAGKACRSATCSTGRRTRARRWTS